MAGRLKLRASSLLMWERWFPVTGVRLLLSGKSLMLVRCWISVCGLLRKTTTLLNLRNGMVVAGMLVPLVSVSQLMRFPHFFAVLCNRGLLEPAYAGSILMVAILGVLN